MTFMCGWAHSLNNTDFALENSCLVFSLSVSRLSEGTSALYVIEFVNYSNSVNINTKLRNLSQWHTHIIDYLRRWGLKFKAF